MLQALATLLVFQTVGEVLSYALALPIPGPVLGMALLLAACGPVCSCFSVSPPTTLP